MEETRFLACKHGTLGGYCGLCIHESRERYAALQHPATIEKIAALEARVRELEAENARLREAATRFEGEVRGIVPDIECDEACVEGLSVCNNAHARLLLIRACDGLSAALKGEGG